MASEVQISSQFPIDLSSFETERLLFFDRFSVYRRPDFTEIHFGFFGRARELQKGLIVILPLQVLEEQKENLLQYLKLLGMPDSETLPGCDIRSGDADVIPADVIGMARQGAGLAEVTFHIMSWKVVVEALRSGQQQPVRPLCAAILRCSLNLQKRLILALYDDENTEQTPT